MAVFAITPVDTTFTVQVGENTAAAAAFATDAAQSAAYAGGFETPEYATQSAGDAATTPGQIFRVPLGTSPQTFNWFRRLLSGSEAVSPLATNAALAAPNGSSLSGFIQSGAGAVATTIESVLRAGDVTPLQFMSAAVAARVLLRTSTTADAAAITAAIQAAIDTGKRVRMPNGLYHVGSGFNITAPTYIQGESKGVTIQLPASASFDLFRIASSNVMIKDITVQGNGTQTGSIFKLRSSVGSYEMFFFENVEARQCHHFLTDDNSTGVLTLCYIENCFHRQPTGNGIDVNDILAYFFLDRFTVDYVGVTAVSSNTPGIRVRNCQGNRFTSVDILGGTIAGFGSRRGFDIQNSEAVWLNRCVADTMGGEGVFLSNCNGVYLTEVTGSLCDLHQIVINACVNVVGTALYAGGRNALTGTAAQDGVRISGGSTAVALSSVFAASNTGHGLHITDAGSSAVVTSLTSRVNTLRGFRCAGQSSMITGVQLASNTAGNYELVGTFDHATSTQLNSGALVVNATGPVTA